MAGILQQTDAEQTVGVKVEGLYEGSLLTLYVLHLLDGQHKLFAVVDGLHRFAVVGQRDAGKECGMCFHGSFDGMAQPLSVYRTVDGV